jgi:ABC-type sugar transport system substrate-binding protein
MKSGTLSGTIARYPFTIGELGSEGLDAIRKTSIPVNVVAPVLLVTKDNFA